MWGLYLVQSTNQMISVEPTMGVSRGPQRVYNHRHMDLKTIKFTGVVWGGMGRYGAVRGGMECMGWYGVYGVVWGGMEWHGVA